MKASKPYSALARWSPRIEKLPALSLRQPWAWLVVNGYKDIENRSWRTNHRGPLLIHAGSSDRELTIDLKNHIKDKYGVALPETVETGGIVGVVGVVYCVKS